MERHGLTGLLYASQARRVQPSAGAIARLQEQYLITCASNMRALKQLEEIAFAFTKYGIPMIVLKGCAAILFLYDGLGLREFDDIDLLIQERHLADARKIMEELGYESAD